MHIRCSICCLTRTITLLSLACAVLPFHVTYRQSAVNESEQRTARSFVLLTPLCTPIRRVSTMREHPPERSQIICRSAAVRCGLVAAQAGNVTALTGVSCEAVLLPASGMSCLLCWPHHFFRLPKNGSLATCLFYFVTPRDLCILSCHCLPSLGFTRAHSLYYVRYNYLYRQVYENFTRNAVF